LKTLLICHDKALLNLNGIGRWLASFSDLVGIVVLREGPGRVRRRVRREIKRVGLLRFLDVVAFRVYYKLFLSRGDKTWAAKKLGKLESEFDGIPETTRYLYSASPNTLEVENFIRNLAPDIVIARCKTLIKKAIFEIPPKGTFVIHPGICPEYRNAHGCFWALANDDLEKVGATLLKINEGVDSGPVYGYFTYPFDESNETHFIIQNRVVLDNLNDIRNKLIEIYEGKAVPINTTGRPSAMWGQPWLTRYIKWKRAARKRNR
jgi:hypothetical protein